MTVVINSQIAGGSSSTALGSTDVLSWAADTGLSRISAGVVGVGNGTQGAYGGTLQAQTLYLLGGTPLVQLSHQNGATEYIGQATELLTLSTAGTTTDTTANLLPANSIIDAVVARVTATITTATSWQLGDPTTPGRFTAANSTMTAGTTDVGTLQQDGTGATGVRQTAAAKVRVTTVGTPSAGSVRITVFYRQFVAPSS